MQETQATRLRSSLPTTQLPRKQYIADISAQILYPPLSDNKRRRQSATPTVRTGRSVVNKRNDEPLQVKPASKPDLCSLWSFYV